MKRTGKKLQGIIPAIVTPIDEDGKLNLKLLEKQAGYLLDGGVQGLFACGGTGEGAYLKTEEKRLVFHTLKQMLPEDKFLCAALINSNTRAVADEIRSFGRSGSGLYSGNCTLLSCSVPGRYSGTLYDNCEEITCSADRIQYSVYNP